jgi:serine protease
VRWAAGLAPAQAANGQTIVNPTPADVINLSLSVGIPCPASLQAAINDAVAAGAVIVVAAGNKAGPAKDYAPANCANVIAVAANDEKGNLAYYSNYGPEVRVLAPGGDVFADADNDGHPDGILSTRSTSADCYDPQTGAPAQTCYYSYLQGTSMAAPHVAAALALLKAQMHVSGKQLEDALMVRALSPIDPSQCAVPCAKDQADGPIAGAPGQCLRECGRGMLDMAHAAAQP